MSSGTVNYICRSRSRAIETLGLEYESWQRDTIDAAVAHDVEDWIKECLDVGEKTISLYTSTRQLLRSNSLMGPQETGQGLLALFQETTRLFDRVQSGVEAAQRNGYSIENETAFTVMRASVAAARERLRLNWPWVDVRMWDRTRTAIAQGDYQTAEEIARELRGSHSEADPG